MSFAEIEVQPKTPAKGKLPLDESLRVVDESSTRRAPRKDFEVGMEQRNFIL